MTEALEQEIRTLRSIFQSDRDPEGRVFAPLADAHRRAGDVPEAMRLLDDGLARHPDFVPGHVVAAQLYVEQGLAVEGALAARRALELDHECVNALRSLLAALEESGETDEAMDVQARLVALDPDLVAQAALAPASPGRGEGADEADLGLEPSLTADAATVVDPDADTVPLPGLETRQQSPGPDSPVDRRAEEGPVGLEPGFDDPTVVRAPLTAGWQPEQEETEQPTVELAALAPDPEPLPEEPVIGLDSLAPQPVEEMTGDSTEDAVDLAWLAPDPDEPEEVGQPTVDLASLAPDPEPTVELSALAPDPEPVLAEPVIDLDSLAPAVEEVTEDAVDVGSLAPEPVEPVEDEPATVELAALAPDPEPELESVWAEPVIDLDSLAPEPAGEVVSEDAVDLASLAPDPEGTEAVEPATVELAALAPDPEPALESVSAEPVIDLDSLAPEPAERVAIDDAVDLGSLAPDPEPAGDDAGADVAPGPEEIIIDLDALGPSDGPALAATQDVPPDEEDAGEPVYTRTLGELYVTQGAVDKALDVFRHLLEQDPADAEIAQRVAELEEGGSAADDVPGDEEVEALARDLAESGDGEHEVDTPFAWADQAEPAASTGPSIRDYFDGLLSWEPREGP